jgi:glycine hydroxymethyltransferase
MAAFAAVLKPGDTILAMSLENGGHLTHGSPVNFSGKLYNVIFYNVNKDGYIDYNDLKNMIYAYNPKLILAGASAYSREIEFITIYNIIEEVKKIFKNYKPYFMVDMAHIAGLVAADAHPSPFGLADIITTTTHKTLRGPRGGLIFCKPELATKIDSAVFPGHQGGPLMHVIAGKAICAEEACQPAYHNYIEQVVKNATAMADTFISLGYKVVSGGTDNHMFLIDLSETHPNISGKMVQDCLDKIGITLNKNCVPNEKRSPKETSGVRIGTPAMTTRGWVEEDFINCAKVIDNAIRGMV